MDNKYDEFCSCCEHSDKGDFCAFCIYDFKVPTNWFPSDDYTSHVFPQKVIEQAKLIRSLSDKYNDSGLTSLYFPSAEKEKKEKEMDNKYYYEFQKAIDKYCDNDVIATEAVIKEMDKEKQVNGIKDSGDRTEFATGAVRDIHAGKGRFDLLPWHAIWDVAKHCENGAFKYGERNVNKGIPQHSLIDSAYRHMTEYLLGFKDEEHLRAACWNLLWALEQCTTHPELLDIPWKDEEVVVVAKYEDGSEWIKKSPKPSEESQKNHSRYCDGCEFDGFIAVECNSCVDGNNYCKEEK